MNDLHIYLLKVAAGMAIISIPYYFLLRNDPNLNKITSNQISGGPLS